MGGGLTYSGAGVSIDAGDELVKRIAPLAKGTYDLRVLSGVGGFSGFFRLDYDNKLFRRRYRDPVLVASTDGVGTKLEIAAAAGRHDTIGIDLVAMCVNDVIVCGAEPLFFLDYYVTDRLDVDTAADVMKGIAEGCNRAGCALLGGETAEHPGAFPKGRYDLAGFVVGVVERKKLTVGRHVEPGDIVLGLASNGLHSNGFSLVRKIVFEKLALSVSDRIEELDTTVADALLAPTRIYARGVRAALAAYRVKHVVKAMAHISGGGLVENVPRVLPEGISVKLAKNSWPAPAIFEFLREAGDIDEAEMRRVFNMGIGFVMIVSPYYADAVKRRLERAGETVYRMGKAVSTPGKSEVIFP
ncbi:MAG: phosphoribosylformylglycinamidine cyclo-ligase [Planctomycetota bacterium]|jgi:phosphoribosylformylglycinamidine cyclo-ligase